MGLAENWLYIQFDHISDIYCVWEYKQCKDFNDASLQDN